MGRGYVFFVSGVGVLGAWLALAPGPAAASHLSGFPECSDGHDNDGDLVADWPGDSNCTGLTDDSEGATSGGGGSDLFVTFLTQWDNGSGGAPDVVCEHTAVAQPGTPLDALTLQPVDVNQGCESGTADVSVGVRVPLNLDTKRPSIKVNKISGGSLPLRVEVVQVDSQAPARRETVGYDALDSSAPGTFTAALDLNDQDGSAATDDILVDLTVGFPSNQLALVTDNYHPGETLNTRNSLHRNRVNFRDPDGSDGSTKVPGAAHIDISSATNHQRIDLARNPGEPGGGIPAVMDFLISKPKDDPKVSGTLDLLPPNASIDVLDEDTAADTDATPDRKTIIYDADATVDVATVDVETVRRLPRKRPVVSSGKRPGLTCEVILCGPPKRLKIHSRVEDLPGDPADDEDVKLVYSGAEDRLSYDASADVPFARVIADDEAPLFNRAHWLKVELTRAPKHLDAELGSGRFEFGTPDQRGIGYVKFDALQAAPTFPTFCIHPCEDGVGMADTQTYYGISGGISRLKTADITFAPDLDVRVDTAPEFVDPNPCTKAKGTIICKGAEQVPIWRTPINVSLNLPKDPKDYSKGQQQISGRISTLQPNTRLQMGKASATRSQIVYGDASARGPNSGPDVRLDGINMPDLPKGTNGVRAKDLHVRLKNMPRRLHFSYQRNRPGEEGGGFPLKLEASGTDNILDELDLQMTSGPDERLPQTECIDQGSTPCAIYRRLDGLYSRDTDSKYVLHARLTAVKELFLHKFGDGRSDFLIGDVKANAFNDIERVLRIDTHRQLKTRFGQDNPQTGTETLKATLDKLPQRVELTAISGPVRTSIDYRGRNSSGQPQPVELFEYDKDTTWPGYSVANSGEALSARPMPASLEICKMESQPNCAKGVFDDNLRRVKQGIGLGGINVSPDQANQGSIGIHADPPTHLGYFATPNQSVAFTQLSLDVDDFALQAHQRKFDYGATDVGAPDGKRGFLAMDTDWDPATEAAGDSDVVGTIKVVKNTNDITEFDYPEGWASDQHVFAFERTGLVTGKVIGIGKVNCPEGTYLRAGDEITDRFCKSRLTELGFKTSE
ncbi:MAG: hypothetical protein ACR2G3_01660 [Solirubrobacterales bacterium]